MSSTAAAICDTPHQSRGTAGTSNQSAATKALQSVALQLLDDHLGHCVQDAIVKGGAEADAKVAEAARAIARLMRA